MTIYKGFELPRQVPKLKRRTSPRQAPEKKTHLTIIIPVETLIKLNEAKWASRLPRTEVLKRIINMFVMMEIDDQVKWLHKYSSKMGDAILG